jgi:glycosyltransferase involved in cell wall biosynthesis
LSGDVIIGTNTGTCAYPQIETFNFHCFKLSHYATVLNNILSFVNMLKLSFKLCHNKKNKYSAIISPNPLITGFVALGIGKLFKIKTVIEVNGDFKEAFKYGPHGEICLKKADKLKENIALKMIAFCITHCDMVKTLYVNQLDQLNIPSSKIHASSYFPDFVSVSKFINNKKTDGKYILLLGFPWYLKGVDILIKAFNKISGDFPDYSLKIHGWNPVDNEYFENLAKNNSRIHLGKALNYSEVVEVITACSIYVLASRTEAMGRVLIEAMSSCKPIIASNVGGVSSIIKDGFNGLLFEKENVDELAQKLRLLLTDRNLCEKLAQNGFIYSKEKLSEECYLQSFVNMIDNL